MLQNWGDDDDDSDGDDIDNCDDIDAWRNEMMIMIALHMYIVVIKRPTKLDLKRWRDIGAVEYRLVIGCDCWYDTDDNKDDN